MTTFKPMLASAADLASLKYPLYASPKLDGIRAVVKGGKLLSRKLLPIPNPFVQRSFTEVVWPGLVVDQVTAKLRGYTAGFDGELIFGSPVADDVYRKTNSAVMSYTGSPAVTFHVFDHIDMLGDFEKRFLYLSKVLDKAPANIVLHPQTLIRNRDELDGFEDFCVSQGYEGVITRRPDGHYKFGRSTAIEQLMLKVKRFTDSEAEIIGVVEEMHNTNEALRDELGRTKRSKAKAGMVGKGTMGALKVRDLTTGVEFEIGSGFTAIDRSREWKLGEIVTYKYFAVGIKDKPRHPVYKGLRSKFEV